MMNLRRMVRDIMFQIVRKELALFLVDREAELLEVFQVELERLDDELPEENLFIDIKIAPMGDMILKAAMRACYRFLTEDVPAK